MGYSGAGGKLIDEKNQKQKISWHCPFKSESHLEENEKRGEMITKNDNINNNTKYCSRKNDNTKMITFVDFGSDNI
jgi:hypothetical protein